MIIKRVQLENFKSHINTEIDFDTGISIIMGENGAGKSSILEAISFGLFKEFTSKKMDKLINNDQNQMEVKVEFIANGRKYRVVRKRKRNSTPESVLYIENDGRFSPIQKGDAAVTVEIEKIISLDKNLFLNAVYVRQGEISNLITKNPSEKKEMMGRLLGVDNLENSWKSMKFVIDEYKQREIRINGKLDNFEKVQNNLNQKEQEKEELTAIVDNKEHELKKTKEKLQKFKNIKEFFDKKESEFRSINEKIEHEKYILTRLNTSKTDLSEKIEGIIIKEKEIEEIQPEISKIQILEDLKEKISKLRELKNDEEYINKSLRKNEGFKNILLENREDYNKFNNLELKISELLKIREQFEGSDVLKINYENRISKISEEMDTIQKNVSKKLKEYGEILNTEINSIEELESNLQIEKRNLKKKKEQNENQINDFNSKISDLKGQNKEINKAINELKQAKDICPVCESKLEEDRRESLLKKYTSQIDDNNNLIFSIKGNLEIWKSDREDLEQKNLTLDKINIYGLKKDSEDLEKYIREIKELELKVDEIKGSVKKLKEINLELDNKKIKKEQLELYYKKYIGAENYLKSTEDPKELLVSLKEIEGQIKPLKAEISVLSEKINVKIEEVTISLENLRKIKERFDKLKGEISGKEDVLKNLNDIKSEIQDHSIKMENLNENIVKIGYEKEKHNLANLNLDNAQTEFEDSNSEINDLKGQLKELNKGIIDLKKDIESFIEDKKELEKLSRFIDFLIEIRNLYGKDGLQKDLRNKSRPLIEKNTLDFFNKFNFEYSDIRLSDDYDVTLFGPSGENTLDMISGGEIVAAALALRLGIAKTLVKGNLELMILDEPTIHLDSYRRHELIDVIKKLSVVPQMIIVTHDSGLEEAASNILKIEKENGKSRIVSV